MRSLHAGIVLLLLLCGLTSPLIAQEEAPPNAIVLGHQDMIPIPLPDLSGLEGAVQQQLREQQDTLQGLIESAERKPEIFSPAIGTLGQMYHAYGFAASAEASYLNTLVLAPSDITWHFSLALLYKEQGELDAAVRTFETVLDLDPENVAAMVYIGEILFELDRKTSAELFLDRALKKAPGTLAATARLGEIALSRQQHQEAADLLGSVLEKLPEANRLHHPLGMAYRGLGDLEKARHHLGQAGKVGVKVDDPYAAEIQSYRTGERLFLLEGRRAFSAGRFEESVDAFQRAVEVAPDSVRARVNLGSALAQSGRVGEGIVELQAALELDPQNTTAHFNLGQLMVQTQRFDEGYGHLQEAVRLDPGDPGPRMEIGSLLRRAGQLDAALGHYQKAIELYPQGERARLGEAAVLVDLGRLAEAKEKLEKAHQEIPWDGGLAHALAKLLAASPDLSIRDGKRALNLAERVFQAQKSVPHAITVAQALAELGQCEDAATWQANAIDAAEQGGQTELAAGLRGSLETYKNGPPCRPPGS